MFLYCTSPLHIHLSAQSKVKSDYACACASAAHGFAFDSTYSTAVRGLWGHCTPPFARSPGIRTKLGGHCSGRHQHISCRGLFEGLASSGPVRGASSHVGLFSSVHAAAYICLLTRSLKMPLKRSRREDSMQVF